MTIHSESSKIHPPGDRTYFLLLPLLAGLFFSSQRLLLPASGVLLLLSEPEHGRNRPLLPGPHRVPPVKCLLHPCCLPALRVLPTMFPTFLSPESLLGTLDGPEPH